MTTKKIYLLDNFDSFTYNLVDEFRKEGHEVSIYRNSVSEDDIIKKMESEKEEPVLVLSPGPSTPEDAGCMLKLIQKAIGKFPIIGICLGHQALCQHYGAKITNAPSIVHGKASLVNHTNHAVFKDMPNPLPVARYHSLIATELPKNIEVIASLDNMPMAILNRKDRVIGFQFHPESILTTFGAKLLNQSIDFVSKPLPNTKALISKVYEGLDLTQEESITLFDTIFAGDMNPIELGSFLTALKIKGEKPEEIAGAATSMLKAATYFNRKRDFEVGEIVGTGGDGVGSINISTMSSIVAATCGLHIAKHGNRSVSSKTGASDLLKALGVNITMTPETSFNTLKSTGVTFLFAPVYHSAMRFAAPVRAALGVRTIFNILGPLTNPSHPDYIVLGVYAKELIPVMAEVLKNNGMKRGFVVHGSGLDEIAMHGETNYALLNNGEITYGTLNPEDFGLQKYPLEGILGGAPEENRDITLNILKGKGTDAQNASVAANTAALLYLGGKVKTLKEGATLALETLKSGKAYLKLQDFINATIKE